MATEYESIWHCVLRNYSTDKKSFLCFIFEQRALALIELEHPLEQKAMNEIRF